MSMVMHDMEKNRTGKDRVSKGGDGYLKQVSQRRPHLNRHLS